MCDVLAASFSPLEYFLGLRSLCALLLYVGVVDDPVYGPAGAKRAFELHVEEREKISSAR